MFQRGIFINIIINKSCFLVLDIEPRASTTEFHYQPKKMMRICCGTLGDYEKTFVHNIEPAFTSKYIINILCAKYFARSRNLVAHCNHSYCTLRVLSIVISMY